MPDIKECDNCGDANKNLRRCPVCGRSICPYCGEDGHNNAAGEECSGDIEVEA